MKVENYHNTEATGTNSIITTAVGVLAYAGCRSSNSTITTAIGVQGQYTHSTTGTTLATGASLYATTPGLSAAVGVVTNSFGLRVENHGHAKVVNAYGIYVNAQSAATTLNYALYTNAGLVHFGDTVDLASGKNLTLLAGNITTDTTTGTKIGTATNQKIAFFNSTPIVQPTALTTQLTTITFTAPGVADYALQDVTNVAPYGFTDAEELRSFISVVNNLQVRLAEAETKLKALGLLA